MIRTFALVAVLVSAPLIAQAAASSDQVSATGASRGSEVISMDDGAGRNMTVVTGGGDKAVWSHGPGSREVLSYTDDAGRPVHVYADHPVTRAEVDRMRETARREGEHAREEGRRAREDGLRAAAEGRREAELARAEGARAREEGLRAAAEGRRAAEEGRREAERARAEAQRAADETRREFGADH